MKLSDFLKTASEEQKNLLINIVDLNQKTKNIYENPNNTHGCPLVQIRINRTKMKEYFLKAVELEMGNLDMIKRNYNKFV